MVTKEFMEAQIEELHKQRQKLWRLRRKQERLAAKAARRLSVLQGRIAETKKRQFAEWRAREAMEVLRDLL